jgi:hypothetical protein
MTCAISRLRSERTARLRLFGPLIRGPAQYTRPDPLGRVASLGQDGRFGLRRPAPVRRLDRASLRTRRMGSSPQTKELHMPEKSPQKPAGKKPGKSLKEKREAKRDKKSTKTALGH